MDHEGFISNMYDAAYTIACMKRGTRSRIIFNRTVIIAMFDFLEYDGCYFWNFKIYLREMCLLYENHEDIRSAEYAFVVCWAQVVGWKYPSIIIRSSD